MDNLGITGIVEVEVDFLNDVVRPFFVVGRFSHNLIYLYLVGLLSSCLIVTEVYNL